MRENRFLRSFVSLAAIVLLPAAGAAAAPGGEPSARSSSVRGMTVPSILAAGGWEEIGEEIDGPPRPTLLGESPLRELFDSTWQRIDTKSFALPIAAGEALAIRFDWPGDDTLALIGPDDPVTARAWQAIAYAPDWLAVDLRDAFSRHDSATQDTLAGLILAAADPFVDEIAFTVAHTAPEVLASADFYFDLVVENAADVYAFDSQLDYADIVDYGSASAGGDYYSTIRYSTAAARGTTLVELPRERYYGDIVHPKITDEFPTYIDPATGQAADPPVGRFWREFLFTHADSGFLPLSDYLAGVQTVWEGNTDSQTNGAVGAITRWILDVLDFGSGSERPIQPVRIYRLHLGRCGEHADITCAAARAALIPTNSSSAPDEDHTWNEFWDRRWVPWEPVNNYVDSGWHYEGWGKSFVGIFDWRGDGWTWTVTERYTPACTLTVEASDSLGYPMDGALVRIGRKLGPGNYIQSCWGYTNRLGLADFLLGDENDIFVRIETPVGDFPDGPLYRKAVSSAVADSHYFYAKSIVGERPSLPAQPMNYPTPAWDTYGIRVTWSADEEIIYGGNQYTSGTFADRQATGALAFFACDDENFGLYEAGAPFWAYEIARDAPSGSVDFVYPLAGSWCAVLSNEEHIVNKSLVSGTAELWRRTTTDVAAAPDAPARVLLGANRPNPFNPSTAIDFRLPRKARLSLEVFDASGRLVRTLVDAVLPAGARSVSWDGTDNAGRPVASGTYFARLMAEGTRLQRKLVLLK